MTQHEIHMIIIKHFIYQCKSHLKLDVFVLRGNLQQRMSNQTEKDCLPYGGVRLKVVRLKYFYKELTYIPPRYVKESVLERCPSYLFGQLFSGRGVIANEFFQIGAFQKIRTTNSRFLTHQPFSYRIITLRRKTSLRYVTLGHD